MWRARRSFSASSVYRGNGLAICVALCLCLDSAALLADGASGGANPFVGTKTNDNAAAGNIGEYVESNIVTPVSITSVTPTNLTSISLTAGDWDVWGNIAFNGAGGATLTLQLAGISLTSNTFGPDNRGYGQYSVSDIIGSTIAPPVFRVSIASTTTVYMVGRVTFSTGSCSMAGTLSARRAR